MRFRFPAHLLSLLLTLSFLSCSAGSSSTYVPLPLGVSTVESIGIVSSSIGNPEVTFDLWVERVWWNQPEDNTIEVNVTVGSTHLIEALVEIMFHNQETGRGYLLGSFVVPLQQGTVTIPPSVDISLLPFGQYLVSARVDADYQWLEKTEGNNYASAEELVVWQ